MEPVVYITGHRNPDTDSICAAIAYAELKKKLGVQALACRLGEVNRETAFVLNHFGVKAPENLVTVKTQVCDLDMDPANAVSPGISVKAAWRIMRKHNVKTLPVVDDHQKLMGLLTVSDITTRYLDAIDNNPHRCQSDAPRQRGGDPQCPAGVGERQGLQPRGQDRHRGGPGPMTCNPLWTRGISSSPGTASTPS